MARILDALRHPPRWMVVSRSVNTIQLAGVAVLVVGLVVGLGELAALWNGWARLGVYLAYAGLVVWYLLAGVRGQLHQAFHVSFQRALARPKFNIFKLGLRWPLSVATAVVVPAYVLMTVVLDTVGAIMEVFSLLIGSIIMILGGVLMFYFAALVLVWLLGLAWQIALIGLVVIALIACVIAGIFGGLS